MKKVAQRYKIDTYAYSQSYNKFYKVNNVKVNIFSSQSGKVFRSIALFYLNELVDKNWA